MDEKLKESMRYFFTSNPSLRVKGRPTLKQLGITEFDFFCGTDTIKIFITLYKPGLIIGSGGRVYNELIGFLKTETGYNIDIEIEGVKYFDFYTK